MFPPQVALYTTNMTNLQNITGEQLGAYFGYAVTTSDVDGDGADDLIIGAPMYTNANNNYETGRVYIVYQGREVRCSSVLFNKKIMTFE